MNEKPIRQNTIVSTTDKRLTLLQWLKALDKNVTELQENGVKASFKVITADEFIKSHENEPTGVDFAVIDNGGEYWFIFGNYAIEFVDDENAVIRVNGFLGNVYNLPDDPFARAFSAGLLYLMKNVNVWEIYDNDPWGNDSSVEFATLSHIEQLKEAVQLATQKTYWHTINLHNSGTLSDVHITIVIPSHSSNPVANDQDLLAIGAGDIWGCSGTIATAESALPIVTFDGVKFGATADATIFSGTLGRTYTLTQLIAKSLEYSDNVKEVK